MKIISNTPFIIRTFLLTNIKSVERMTITKKRIISLAAKFADFNMFLFITF